MSRSVETCVRVGQNCLFSNTQDILNILTGSLLQNEQGGEPAVVRDEERFSGECLTDGEWKNHLLLEEPTESMLYAKVHVFSDSVFCTGLGASDPTRRPRSVHRETDCVS